MAPALAASVALAAMASLGPAVAAAATAPGAEAVGPLPGLWSMTIRVDDRPPTTMKVCIGRTVPQAWRQFFGNAAKSPDPACAFKRASRDGQLTLSRSCTTREGKLTLTQEMSSVVSERRMHMVMARATKGDGREAAATPAQRTVADGAYLSPCPPTMKEGQLLLPDGRITDPLTMMREAGDAVERELKGLDAKAPGPPSKAAASKRKPQP